MDNIKQIIEERNKELKITSLDVSFNELADMYKSSELIIQPEYQRTFRWDIGKQSRFIESLLMEMPIPPIYVIELDDGSYELIDGLQRISTYLSFRGILNCKEDVHNEHVGDIENYFEDFLEDSENENRNVLFCDFKLEGCDITERPPAKAGGFFCD